jgi:hypothetical protein
MRFLCIAMAFGVLTVSMSGCGNDGGIAAPDMYDVSGTVTVGGKPLEKGSVIFDPVGGEGLPVGGGVVNGEYSLKVPAGDKIVRFTAVAETEEKDQYGAPVTVSLIPARYDTDSGLTATVSASGENKFDFLLDAE